MAGILLLLLAANPAQDAEAETLIRALGSDVPGERDEAERRLVRLGERARPAAEAACRSEDPEVSGRARRVLRALVPALRLQRLRAAGFRKEDVELLHGSMDRLWAPDPGTVAKAVREIAPVAGGRNLRAIAATLEREGLGDEVRWAFAEAMEDLREPGLAPTVLPLLRHPLSHYRERALKALAAAGAKETEPWIVALLEDPDACPHALQALERMGLRPSVEAVRRMLVSTEDRVRVMGIETARKHRLPGLTSEIVQALVRTQSCYAWAAQEAIARSGPTWKDLGPLFESEVVHARLAGLRLALDARLPEALEGAARLLDDPAEEARAGAIAVFLAWDGPEPAARAARGKGPGSLLALARLGAPGARERALEALASPDPVLRRCAITALRALDAHDEARRISDLLDDPSPEVRGEAARVLPHLAGDGIGPRLAAMLAKEEEPVVQAHLLRAVAETGCRDAAADVLRLLREGKDEVRYPAAGAAGALRLREASSLLGYEQLLQIRPPDLVELLRARLRKPKEEDMEAARLRRDEERNEGVLYLLYVDSPGARELLLQCLKDGIVPQHPVEMIRFLGAEEALPWLADQVEGRRPEHLSKAGRLLAAYGRRDMIDSAMKWLSNPNQDVRQAGVELLGGLRAEDRIPEIAALLDAPEGDTQVAAWRALQWIGGPRTVEIFRRRLGEENSINRSWAADFLAGEGDRASIPRIEPLLEDEDPYVRNVAARSLERLGARASYDRILRAAGRGTEKDLWSWRWILAEMGGEKGRALARKDLRHDDPEVRKSALGAMGVGGGFQPAEIREVESLLDDPDVGPQAWDALAQMDPANVVRRVQDPRSRLGRRYWSSVLLDRTIGPPAAIPGMIALLEDHDPGARSHAARLLGEWDAKEAVEPLARALHADDPGLRQAAAVSLVRLGDARGLDEVLRLPRHTTTAQGRMGDALLALNGLRHAEVLRRLLALSWTREGGLDWALREALEDLPRRTAMRVTVSPAIGERALRFPAYGPGRPSSLEGIATDYEWRRFVSFVVEPGEIRVLAPDEALAFWEAWARDRRK